MWICMFCLLAGFSSFLVALSNLYRHAPCRFELFIWRACMQVLVLMSRDCFDSTIELNCLCRLKEEESPVSPLLYGVYYLPTSINTAWLSVASCIGIAIVTSIYHLPAPKLGVIILAAAGTALSELPWNQLLII